MKVPRKKYLFRQKNKRILSNFALALVIIDIIGLIFILNLEAYGGSIVLNNQATPVPTRVSQSFIDEAGAHFMAGDLVLAMETYQKAIDLDPTNTEAYIELARSQIYSSALLTTQEKIPRLEEALENARMAVSVDEFSSDAWAVLTLALDWNAAVTDDPDLREEYFIEASETATRALQLDSENWLATAYRAEVLADQYQYLRAEELAAQALENAPHLMDTHRIYAYILESSGLYMQAIEEYKLAAEIMPNLTFLYINIAQNYREISTKTDLNYWDLALEYFDRAARINQTLTGVNDPLPYVGIANTYERMGEFFIAARNLEKAIEINPTEPVLYGNLALVRFKARNYEGSIPMFECAINGCEIVLDILLGPTLLDDSNREDYVGEETYFVEGIPLGNDSYVFYFSYGSVLAALDLCDEAIPVLTQVGNAYADDDVVTSIVDEGFSICDHTP